MKLGGMKHFMKLGDHGVTKYKVGLLDDCDDTKYKVGWPSMNLRQASILTDEKTRIRAKFWGQDFHLCLEENENQIIFQR